MSATPNDDAEFDAARTAMDLVGLWRAGGTMGEAMGITSEECEALYAFGHAQYEQGRYAEAFKAFAQATVYNHLESRYQEATGAAAQMLGRYEDALRHYLAVTVMRLDDPAPVFHCAECLLALGKPAEAAESFQMVAEMCKEERHAALKSRAEALLQALKARMQQQ